MNFKWSRSFLVLLKFATYLINVLQFHHWDWHLPYKYKQLQNKMKKCNRLKCKYYSQNVTQLEVVMTLLCDYVLIKPQNFDKKLKNKLFQKTEIDL